jgi:hypothetical protein
VPTPAINAGSPFPLRRRMCGFGRPRTPAGPARRRSPRPGAPSWWSALGRTREGRRAGACSEASGNPTVRLAGHILRARPPDSQRR